MEISGRKKVPDQMKLAALEIGPSTQVRPAKKYIQATSVIQDSGLKLLSMGTFIMGRTCSALAKQ